MPIIYALVAHGATVLAEYSGSSGNFIQITRRILEKIPVQDGKGSYHYQQYAFNYLIANEITYLAMADADFSRTVCFTFLEDLQQRFHSSYGDRGKRAAAMGMNSEFSHVLQRQMDYFSTNPNADKLAKVQEDMDSARAVMVDNIEQVLERGDKIDVLVEKTDSLNGDARRFRGQASHLKNAMFWRNFQITAVVIGILLVCYFIHSFIIYWK